MKWGNHSRVLPALDRCVKTDNDNEIKRQVSWNRTSAPLHEMQEPSPVSPERIWNEYEEC